MNDDTNTLKTMAPAMFACRDQRPGDALRLIAQRIAELAAEVDAGRARPLPGAAGMIGRLDEANAWLVDLQMTFEIVNGATH